MVAGKLADRLVRGRAERLHLVVEVRKAQDLLHSKAGLVLELKITAPRTIKVSELDLVLRGLARKTSDIEICVES